ncbi:DUF3667 domain-containing protein [Cognatiluteimonas telluris]|jgi:hypothetical protein|uniref:DUF3667 domain-containing protein n=1 Tax=Cognatiluteimonas telluris TaxID=1104775 RepID=UPI0014084E58|nr:DUF3667 domain-containing protein [Lysobacter telluris]
MTTPSPDDNPASQVSNGDTGLCGAPADPHPGAAATAVLPPTTGAACQNCGAPLLGPHCYRCGQPVNGLVRHFTTVLGDFLDSVLNVDERVFRTLWPLFARPAYLSCEYFAGRRVRYVSPVRLFVFLSIVTFFIARLTLNLSDPMQFGDNAIDSATTIAQVEQRRDAAIAALAAGRLAERGVPAADKAQAARVARADAHMRAAQDKIRASAHKRIAALRAAAARGEPPPANVPDITFGAGKPWNEKTNPLVLNWLPPFANHWVNAQIGRAKANVARMQDDPSLFKDAFLSAIPSTLFVLMPVFALMLKLAYLFKRRLYMEHLIVALHSHAFLCLTLLLVFLATTVRDALAPGFVHGLLSVVEFLLFAWMPLYLLLMQKRVYRQGWPMTVAKYCVLGMSYFMLLSFGAAFTMLASVVWA